MGWRTGSEGSEASAMGISGWAVGIVGVVMLGWYFVPDLLDRGPRKARQEAFVSWCQAQGEPDCEARVEAHHQGCYTLSGGALGSGKLHPKPAFDATRYRECLLLGREAWLVENAENLRKENARKRREIPAELR